MSVPLLATKFYIPPARADLVARPRLTQKLRATLNRPRTWSLLSGPAGSGKTTLLSAFVADLARPVAWLSLDEGDDDPRRFWTYLLTACHSALAGVGEAALSLLEAPQELAADTIPTLLINDLARRDEALILILDDYHLIHSPAIHAGVAFLLDHLPDNLHLVLATRADPPFPLARYRARNRLLELRARDLRFNPEEAAEFLNHTMALELSTAAVAALEGRTEGWAAGLQLAALSLRGHSDIARFIETFTGSHVYVAEYLLEEVLKSQPQEVQAFLLHSAILDRLTPDLCAAVTGQQRARAFLSDLRRANIFVIPLDDEGHWFRFHHLFADLLRARLAQAAPPAEIARLHSRAATWYERQGATAEAIHHALAAGDFQRVAALVEREARSLMFSGQASTLRGWLRALPEASFRAHPRLDLYRLWIDLMQEKADPSAHALREKEKLLRALPPSPENEQLQVELLAVLCRFVAFAGDSDRALRLADEALARLPAGEQALRARAHSARAIACWMEGKAQQAAAAREEALRLARATANYSLAAHILMIQGIEETDYGRLHQAARTYEAIVALGEEAGREIFFPAGQGYIGLAGIHLEWNDLPQAEAYLEQGMTLCRRGGLAGIVTGHVLRARLQQASGNLDAAAETLTHLERSFQSVNPVTTVRQVHFHLAVGDVAGATHFARPWIDLLAAAAPAQPLPLLVAEIVRLTLARLALARGELVRARELLAVVEVTAGPAGRNGRLVDLYLLRALLEQQEHDGQTTPAAVAALAQALTLAEPEGVTLLFLEAGPDLWPLLEAVGRPSQTPAHLSQYAHSLLEAAGAERQAGTSPPPALAAALVEPLTPRELEVLQHIASGDSNQAIADKLFITVRTVKKHAGNIYGKLNVSSRTQAAARAHELGLLPAER